MHSSRMQTPESQVVLWGICIGQIHPDEDPKKRPLPPDRHLLLVCGDAKTDTLGRPTWMKTPLPLDVDLPRQTL